jgi:hypothetical protein
MKYIFLFISIVTFNCFGGEEFLRVADYTIVSNAVDSSLEITKGRITFKLDPAPLLKEEKVTYSINGLEKTAKTFTNPEIVEMLATGSYNFEFVLDEKHYEIFIYSLEVKPQHDIVIQLNFRRSDLNIKMKKPVIYLYPETETQIDIQLNTSGDLTFTYPKYNDGWSVTADSLGNITSNGETFNYLFWEGEHQFNTAKLDRNQGVIVPQNELVSYLEGALTKFGFTSKERADFITYWVPNMKDVTNLYIYFLFNEACDEFATLDISPEPSQTARFYMLWEDAGNDYNEIGLLPQEIPTFNRDGFTVLEWGGAKIETNTKTID